MGNLLQNIKSSTCRWHSASLLTLLVSLFVYTPSHAHVTDRAKVFSKKTLVQANTRIKNIRRFFKAGLKIDTFKTAPGLSKVNGTDYQKNPEFSEWLKKKANRGGSENIYVLMVQTPPYLLVSLGELVRHRDIFPRMERDMLMKMLANRFQQGNFDKGLLEGIAFTFDTLSNRIEGTEIPTYSTLLAQQAAIARVQNAQQNAPKTSFLHWIGLILIGIFGAWLVINLVQTMLNTKKVVPQESS